jgi:hypothetical protein
MRPTPELIDALYMDKIRLARETPSEEKLLDGPRLFDRSCRIMMEGIRDQFPDATDEEVRRILRERLDLVRRLEESA